MIDSSRALQFFRLQSLTTSESLVIVSGKDDHSSLTHSSFQTFFFKSNPICFNFESINVRPSRYACLVSSFLFPPVGLKQQKDALPLFWSTSIRQVIEKLFKNHFQLSLVLTARRDNAELSRDLQTKVAPRRLENFRFENAESCYKVVRYALLLS